MLENLLAEKESLSESLADMVLKRRNLVRPMQGLVVPEDYYAAAFKSDGTVLLSRREDRNYEWMDSVLQWEGITAIAGHKFIFVGVKVDGSCEVVSKG